MVDQIEAASRGDQTAWLVEVAGKLITAYGREESSHAEHGVWQLNVVDGSTPVRVGSVELTGTNSILGRPQTVWACPATDDFFDAHHLMSPVAIDASGVVLLRRAFVGVSRKNGEVVTVLPAASSDFADGPAVRAPYPVVPALVAYAVPRDESQDAEVIFQFRCTPQEAQEALLLPARLPRAYQQSLATREDVLAIVRRLPATSVRHHSVENGGPVPLLRWAMNGGPVDGSDAAGCAVELGQASIALATLAAAAELLPHLGEEERADYWAASLDVAAEVFTVQSWEGLRADQAGPRELGEWVPESVAAMCESTDLFALLLTRALPTPTISARRIGDTVTMAEAELLRHVLGGQRRVMHWCQLALH